MKSSGLGPSIDLHLEGMLDHADEMFAQADEMFKTAFESAPGAAWKTTKITTSDADDERMKEEITMLKEQVRQLQADAVTQKQKPAESVVDENFLEDLKEL